MTACFAPQVSAWRLNAALAGLGLAYVPEIWCSRISQTVNSNVC